MRFIDSQQRSIVYRLCRRFPPVYPDDYVVAGARRSFASHPDQVQRAAHGLSVYSTIAAVVANAEKFPRLGTIVVRYRIPNHTQLQVLHLVGPPAHLTVLGDFGELHSCLDTSWNLRIDTLEE